MHNNVTTTQIYADLVNSKKYETANKISLKLGGNRKGRVKTTSKLSASFSNEWC